MKKRVQRNKVGPLRGPLLISLYVQERREANSERGGREKYNEMGN